MTFKIEGIDITPYIAFQGLQYSINDVDGQNAGRAINGEMIRDKVATKVKWEVSCRPLTATELKTVLGLLHTERRGNNAYVSVEFTDPLTQTDITKTMYSNNIPSQFILKKKNGTEYWGGLKFPLIEK